MNQPELTISLLGGVIIAQNGTAVTGFASRKADGLLAYLACNPRPHPRETIATLFWPDNDQSRALANLSVILTSLRKQLGDYLLAERHTVAFNSEMSFWLDVAAFEQAIAQAQGRQQDGKITRTVAAQLETAVSHYKGDFLAGFNLRGVPEFEAWVLLEQERLRQLMLDALTNLINFHQQRGQFSSGIQYAQRLLALDPLREEIHRQLMQLYALDNQRPAALAQYEQCAAILTEELGVEPDEETTALYQAIRDEKKPGGILAATAPKHNLPAAANSFIGREMELAKIESWLAGADGRLLTIIGPGGMGKTRLAQEAARAHLGEFSDGVWYVSLVPFTAWSELVTAVAEALNLKLTGKEPLPEQLLNQLKPLEALLVLDNLEHLLNDELRDFLSQLTLNAPELRLIATSRERLRLQAEHLLELEGLPYPVFSKQFSVNSELDTDHGPLLTDYPAVQLFANRVHRLAPNFELIREETAVTQLCELVGGLPLALELAATWTRVLSVKEIVAEIQQGLDALTATLYDVPERHRSLRAVIETSWQMLPIDEQALNRRLAVFRGGFTRMAAQQVANATLPQLMSLVDRSFLRLDEDQRFRRHPLLLQFAQEQLAANPQEKAQAGSGHAHFFAALVQAREPELQGAKAPEALAALAADLENIRAAWWWGLANENGQILEKMVMGIGRFYADRSRFLEGTALFSESLETMRQQQPATVALEPLLAQMQVNLGLFLHQNGRFAEAEAILREANRLAHQHNLLPTRILVLRHLGEVVADRGDRKTARQYLAEGLSLCHANQEGAQDKEQRLLLLWRLGILHTDNGEYDEAQAVYGQAMALAEALGNKLHIARLHNSMAIIFNRQKGYDKAVYHWQLARDGFQAWGNDWGVAATTHNLAMAYWGLEQYDKAMAAVDAGLAAHEKIGHKRGIAGGLAVKATIYQAQGKRREARRHYNESMLMSQAVGATWLAVVNLVDLAELEMSYGKLEWAATLLFFVMQHPAALATNLENARRLLEELQAELPEAIMTAAEVAAGQHTLGSLIAQAVVE